ncbi:hypothetical protein D047_3716B, partial [Vibrio parahaemolyticus VPTS-2010_2]
SQNPI